MLPMPLASDHLESKPNGLAAPLRIGMMITSVSAAAGGVAEAARSLTRTLNKEPCTDVEVFSMSEPDPALGPSWGGAQHHCHSVRGPRSFSYAPGLSASLNQRPIDLLHLHGLWQYPSMAVGNWRMRTGRPTLVSPHGMLDAWALNNSRWKKRAAGLLFENGNLHRANCLHALCDAELRAIRDYGLINPVCVIPNGVDPAPGTRPPPPEWRSAMEAETRVLLYFGRLHPKKNLVELLRAWHAARLDSPSARAWRLIVAGSGSADYEQRLHQEIGQLGIGDSVRLIGPQYGADKHACLAWSDAFILPSVSEGLPMAALEAWSWSLPALLTPECNLPEGYSAGGALPMRGDRAGIRTALGQLFSLSDERRQLMGRRGQKLASSRFSWSRVADDFLAVYRWLSEAGDRPDCVGTL